MFFASLGTAMLVFRPLFEPWAPFVFGFLLSTMARHAIYLPPNSYFWVVGWVYLMAVMCFGASAWGAYTKPSADRKVDAYLQARLSLDDSHVARRDPSQPSD